MRMARCGRCYFFFFQAEDGIRDVAVTGVQTCALPIFHADRDVPAALAGVDRVARVGERAVGVEDRGLADDHDRVGRVADRAEEVLPGRQRSEERRVGKECRSWWSPYH